MSSECTPRVTGQRRSTTGAIEHKLWHTRRRRKQSIAVTIARKTVMRMRIVRIGIRIARGYCGAALAAVDLHTAHNPRQQLSPSISLDIR